MLLTFRALPVLADPVNFLAHGLQANTRSSDAGEKSYNSQHNHHPYAKVKPVLKINAQNQKYTGRKQTGEAKLSYPGQ